MIHRKENDMLHKAATYMSVSWPLAKPIHSESEIDLNQAQEFTRNRRQVVNRLKIPQGLSTLMLRRWSEVP